jgi:hypothetical protein
MRLPGHRALLLLSVCALPACKLPPAPSLAAVDQSTQAALVSSVTPGAVVELWQGSPGARMLIATSAVAASGSTQIRLRLRERLSPGQIVQARQRLHFRNSGFSNAVTVENNYVTNRYDNERSGWNPNEFTLSVGRVRNGFGKICEHAVEAPIRAQPLYVQDVDIPGKGRHNVVFVVTDASSGVPAKGDQVWAFDADTCAPLWTGTSGSTGPRELLASGETIPHVTCLSGPHGVWSTPAIDRTTNTLYVVAAVQNSAGSFFRLHALDIATGQDRSTPSVMNGTTVQFTHRAVTASFNPSAQNNRPGLLWDRGVLYVAFGSSCDIGAYHGWIVAYDADLPGTPTFLQQVGVFNTSPEETTQNCDPAQGNPPCMAGIWQSGLGLAADGDGTVYLITGNGNFDPDPGKGSYGNTVLRLRLASPGSASRQMQIVSFFTPFDWRTTYEQNDQDFGSGGPVLFTSGSRRLLLAQGKPKRAYVIDRDCTNCDGNPNRCIPVTGQACASDDPSVPGVAKSPVVQTLGPTGGISDGMVAGPAYHTGPQGLRIYYGFNKTPMAAFGFQPNPPQLLVPPEVTAESAPETSPIPAVSSRGGVPGSAILWAVFHPAAATQPLRLHAYDADDLRTNLFSALTPGSLEVGGWAPLMSHAGNSFQVPTVIRGKVYAGAEDRFVVFGPRNRPLCSRVVDCGGVVTFYCSKDPEAGVFELQRLQNGVWKRAPGFGTKDLERFAYFWDYPGGDGGTYRVCSVTSPDACTPALVANLDRFPCGVGADDCGRPGTPPCFLNRGLPVSAGAATDGRRRGAANR